MTDDDEGFEVARITIRRVILNGGDDVVRVEYSDGLTLLDGLGMLAFATVTAPEDVDEDDD